MINVMAKTMIGIYQLAFKVRLSSAFTEEIIRAVKEDKTRGERFLVSKTDMLLN
jgi:hypothetical protein